MGASDPGMVPLPTRRPTGGGMSFRPYPSPVQVPARGIFFGGAAYNNYKRCEFSIDI